MLTITRTKVRYDIISKKIFLEGDMILLDLIFQV